MRGTLISCERVAKRLVVVLLRNIYTYRLCLRGSVQPSEAGRGETSPFKVLLLALPPFAVSPSLSPPLRLLRRVSCARRPRSSRRPLPLLLPPGSPQPRGSSAGKRARSTTWATTPSTTSRESSTPS